MKPKIAEILQPEDWQLFQRVQAIMEALPAKIPVPTYVWGIRLRESFTQSYIIPNCHMLARALKYFLPVVVHDGMVLEGRIGEEKPIPHNHSWLTRVGGDKRIIFDPQPLGAVSGPAIFIQDYGFHFTESSFVKDPIKRAEFRSCVAATRLAIRHVLAAK